MTWVTVSDELVEQSHKVNASIEQVLAAAPPMQTLEPAVIRAQREAGTGVFPSPVRLQEGADRTIPGPAGEIRLRVFVPERVCIRIWAEPRPIAASMLFVTTWTSSTRSGLVKMAE